MGKTRIDRCAGTVTGRVISKPGDVDQIGVKGAPMTWLKRHWLQ